MLEDQRDEINIEETLADATRGVKQRLDIFY
jgi:hypothetical protein